MGIPSEGWYQGGDPFASSTGRGIRPDAAASLGLSPSLVRERTDQRTAGEYERLGTSGEGARPWVSVSAELQADDLSDRRAYGAITHLKRRRTKINIVHL